ncbi:MAG: class I SAM-dependent methyltransferase [Candidatus Limnocylindria bacterium]
MERCGRDSASGHGDERRTVSRSGRTPTSSNRRCVTPPAEPVRDFFETHPPHSPFAAALRRDPFRRVFRVRDAAWASALRRMPLADGDRLLDVGGADGLIVDRMHALRGTRGVAVDIAFRGLRLARDAAVAADPVQADAVALPFANDTFAGSVSFETLEHLTDWAAAIAELVRVTRRGGHVVVSAVSANWKWTWNWALARAGVDIHSYADHDPARFVDPRALVVALERAGADVLEARELNAFATLAYDELIMVVALLLERGPRWLGRGFLAVAPGLRTVVAPALILSELPWRVTSRSNSILVVARKR